MTVDTPVWHLPGSDGKPVGPYSARQIVESVQRGSISPETLCWRDGMDNWIPLGQVPELAVAMCSVNSVPTPVRRRRIGRWISRLILLACFAAMGLIGYVIVTETLALRNARQLLADQDYDEASSVAESIAEGYVYRDEANYLVAVADIKSYAVADTAPRESQLRNAERRLSNVIKSDEEWRSRAVEDLADGWEEVPAAAEDRVARVLALTRCHEKLKLADATELAAVLLQAAQQAGVPEASAATEGGIILQLLTWDASRGADLVAALLPADAPRQNVLAAYRLIQMWVQQDAQLAAPLAAGLTTHGQTMLEAGDLDSADQLLSTAAGLNPEANQEILAVRLKVIRQRLAAGERNAPFMLQALVNQAPELKGDAAAICIEVAESVRATDVNAAGQAWLAATNYDPAYAETAEGRLLQLRVSPPGQQQKIQLSQKFLVDFPTAEHRAELLLGIVTDAVALVENTKKSLGYVEPAAELGAARDAASELLRDFRECPELDQRVFALCRCLADLNRQEEAFALAGQIVDVIPGSTVRSEIKTMRSQWAVALNGPLPAELQTQAEQVLHRLKITHLDSADQVRKLDTLKPHVVRVANECLASKLMPGDKERLQAWVRQGGILWCNNDVLSWFDIKGTWYRGMYSGVGMYGNQLCSLVFAPEECPLATGCREVEAAGVAFDLQHEEAVPLLKSGSQCCWSLIRYGDGWISNVPTIDVTTRDGARLWLNFRLFCLGDPIPGAASSEFDLEKLQEIAAATASGTTLGYPGSGGTEMRPPGSGLGGSGYPGMGGYDESGYPGSGEFGSLGMDSGDPAPEPTIVVTTEELEALLDRLEDEKVIWIQLTAADVSKESLEKVVQWVQRGGVLWVDTDLVRDPGPASAIGFRMKQAEAHQVRGKVKTNPSLYSHRAIRGLPQEVEYRLSDSQMLLAVRLDDKLNPMDGLEILMAWVPEQMQRTMTALCATKSVSQGIVIFRPREILPDTVGRKFEQNLRRFSFERAR